MTPTVHVYMHVDDKGLSLLMSARAHTLAGTHLHAPARVRTRGHPELGS